MKTGQSKYVVLFSLLWAAPAAAQHALPPTRLSDSSLDQRISLAGTVPPWVGNAKKLGPADDNKRVLITVYLHWRNQKGLGQLIADQTSPDSPQYGKFLTPSQFHARFSPKTEDLRKVQNALSELGFKVGHTPASGLFVEASGTVAQIKNAFHVSQGLYSYRGKTLRAHAEDPSIPAALSGLVSSISGLDDSRLLVRPVRWQHFATVTTSSKIQPPYGYAVNYPCSDYWGDRTAQLESPSPFPYGSDLPWLPCGYTPQQIQQAYGANQVSETGKGVRIAITDLYHSPTLLEDANHFFINHGLPLLNSENFQQIIPPNVNYVPQGDPCEATGGGWWGEQTLDVEAAHSMAPDAVIVFVAGVCNAVDQVNNGVGIDPLYEVIDNRLADIVSNSWAYFGEEDVSPAQLESDNAEFMQAAAQGMSLLFASGDWGDGTPIGQQIASGNWPATSPYVTGIGGTSLLLRNASGEKSEFGWTTYYTSFESASISENGEIVTDKGWLPFAWGGGSSGGPSLVMLQPSYQKKIVPKLMATRTYLASGLPVPLDPPRRVTPDIAMEADPNNGGLLIGETDLISLPPVDAGCLQLSATTEYCELQAGGTSLATPLFAGVLARVDEYRFSQNQGPVGFVNPALYRLPAGKQGSNAPIIDVNAPSEPIGTLLGVMGIDNAAAFFPVDSYADSNGNVIENADTSLRSVAGYDNVTGLGTPNVAPLIEALGH
jgi:subtilase family serine protease